MDKVENFLRKKRLIVGIGALIGITALNGFDGWVIQDVVIILIALLLIITSTVSKKIDGKIISIKVVEKGDPVNIIRELDNRELEEIQNILDRYRRAYLWYSSDKYCKTNALVLDTVTSTHRIYVDNENYQRIKIDNNFFWVSLQKSDYLEIIKMIGK